MTEPDGTLDAAALIRWLRRFAELVGEHRDELTALDSPIGDADHGANMARGTSAAVAALDHDAPAAPGPLLELAGRTLVRTVGGAAGPLYGTFFLRMATALGDGPAPVPAEAFAAALRAGLDGIVARGKAERGDKTMVDALAPAVEAFERDLAQQGDLAAALRAAAVAADAARDATIPLLARKGRASYLGERSIGHQDPGATSAALLVRAAAEALPPGEPMTEGLVGLVVVSHGHDLARAAIGLAAQMLHGEPVRVEQAAGLADGAFGTDAVRVAEAVARADAGRGVVVLMDLGSAVLSAEVALDLMDAGLRERVILCPAPLVEGLCVAVVAAAAGAERGEVAAEARRALTAKEEQLGGGCPDGPTLTLTPARGPAEATGRFEITWPQGLHARPIGALVKAVRALDADVRLRNLTLAGDPVPATSPATVAGLGARQGHVVEVTASGPDAEEAVERLLALAARGFGDLGSS